MTAAPNEDPRSVRSRAVLLEATARLLHQGGVEAVTVDAVTAESGVARATLYRAFPTTAELIAAAMELLLPALHVTVTGRSVRADLIRTVEAYADTLDRVPLHTVTLAWLTLSQSGTHPGADRVLSLQHEIIGRYREPLVAVLTGPRARRALRDDVATEDGLSAAVASLAGPLLFNRLVLATPNERRFCAQLVDDFLRANRRQD